MSSMKRPVKFGWICQVVAIDLALSARAKEQLCGLLIGPCWIDGRVEEMFLQQRSGIQIAVFNMLEWTTAVFLQHTADGNKSARQAELCAKPVENTDVLGSLICVKPVTMIGYDCSRGFMLNAGFWIEFWSLQQVKQMFLNQVLASLYVVLVYWGRMNCYTSLYLPTIQVSSSIYLSTSAMKIMKFSNIFKHVFWRRIGFRRKVPSLAEISAWVHSGWNYGLQKI